MAITFRVDDVERATKTLEFQSAKTIIDKLFRSEAQAYYVPTEQLIAANSHPLVSAIHHAYAEHYPLSISPDHIWLTLCQGLAQHINMHAEELRGGIVKHQGKSTLTVLHPELKRGNYNNIPWTKIFALYSKMIRHFIGDELHDLFTPQFSTTTPTIKAAYEVTLMDSMQAYFVYWLTRCGIPEITLEGTVEDWELISEQIEKFRQFKLDWWVDALNPIMKQFVAAAKGNIDPVFWSHIYKLSDASGGPYVSGWILKLFPYVKQDANYPFLKRNRFVETEPTMEHFDLGLQTSSFPTGLSTAPVICDDKEQVWEISVLAGFVGISQDSQTLALRPEIGWAIRDETLMKEKEQAKRRKLRQDKHTDPHPTLLFMNKNKHRIYIQRIEGVFYISRHERKQNDTSPLDSFIVPENGWTEFEHEGEIFRYDSTELAEEHMMRAREIHRQEEIRDAEMQKLFQSGW